MQVHEPDQAVAALARWGIKIRGFVIVSIPHNRAIHI